VEQAGDVVAGKAAIGQVKNPRGARRKPWTGGQFAVPDLQQNPTMPQLENIEAIEKLTPRYLRS